MRHFGIAFSEDMADKKVCVCASWKMQHEKAPLVESQRFMDSRATVFKETLKVGGIMLPTINFNYTRADN